MAQSGWGQGRSAEADAGLLDVLTALVSQGGALYGARRLADSPLTLTDVRWQGAGGTMMDASRRNPTENDEPNAEREVWVQLALNCPIPRPPQAQESPWQPIAVTREAAMGWVSSLRHEREQARRASSASYGPGGGSLPYPSGHGPSVPGRADPSRHAPTSSPNPMFMPAPPSVPLTTDYRQSAAPRVSVSLRPSGQLPGGGSYPPMDSSYDAGEDARQATGAWQRNDGENGEIVVLPCIEVELPPQGDVTTAEYRRDFSRDVAMHFGRAVRAIPQVREARGWMRGDLLVLAARFVLGRGPRQATRQEMEATARYLAGVLAQRTLPYVRLGFADPGEWMQGAALPE